MNIDHTAAATKLAEATTRGALASAYDVVRRLRCRDLSEVAIRAGFTIRVTRDVRELRVYLQSQIADACRLRTDGFGLRAMTE